ncbi:hypothetical protein [Acinetobacter sp. ANC 4633]|nr:hypothetical protein [Acinetobacter sp. ANC 4633]
MRLHGVVAYEATPTQMQVVFYLSSIAIIWLAAKKMKAHVTAA